MGRFAGSGSVSNAFYVAIRGDLTDTIPSRPAPTTGEKPPSRRHHRDPDPFLSPPFLSPSFSLTCMDKKTWIVVTLCILGIIGLEMYNQQVRTERARELARLQAAQKAEEAAQAAANPAAAEAAETPAATATATAAPATAEVSPTPTPEPQIPEENITLENEFFRVNVTNRGAGVRGIYLLSHEAEGGEPVTLDRDTEIPVAALSEDPKPESLPNYEVLAHDSSSVTMRHVTGDQIQIDRVIRLPELKELRDEYRIEVETTFTNLGDQTFRSGDLYFHVGSAAPIHEKDLPIHTALDYFEDGKAHQIDVNWFEPSRIPLIGIQLRGRRPVFQGETAPPIGWVGVKNQFFTTIAIPREFSAESVVGNQLRLERGDDPNRPWLGIEAAMGFPTLSIPPGEATTAVVDVYAGPKEYRRLEALGSDTSEVMRLGWFKPISLTLLWAMNFFNSIFNNYAVAIIVLTLCIKGLLWPLQNKAMKSMRKMSVLAPKMKEMREKYKDDPVTANQETMKLYKDYGVNPFGSCLPMLIQIPIFFGFYTMLGSAVELRNSGFLWVEDLSQPDTVFRLGGFPINILPIVMGGTMVWQMAISPKTGDVAQQRIMMLMPLMFLAFCYNYASGLALYWTTQNLFSIVQLYITRNEPLPTLTKVKKPEPKALPNPMGQQKKKKPKKRLRTRP